MKGKVEAFVPKVKYLWFINGAWLVDLRQIWVVLAYKVLKLNELVEHHEQHDANTHDQAIDGRYRVLAL